MTAPTVFTWPLVIPGISPIGIIPSSSYLAPGGGIATVSPTYLTEENLLALIEQLLPEWYLSPLKSPGPGYEILQAFAKTMERVSLAIGRFEVANYVVSSHGGVRATGTVEFYRNSLGSGSFSILKNTIVRTTKTNRSYRTTADIAFGGADYVVSAQVEALGYGPEYNVTGPVFAADGTLLAGEIDKVVIPLMNPLFAEPTIQVRQVSDMVGGQAQVLDQLSLDRNLPRLAGESDESLKGRTRALPDTVSIEAIRRTLDAIFLPMGLTYELYETWQNAYQTCWDAPDAVVLNQVMGDVLPEVFVFDPVTTLFRGRWMDDRDCPSGIVVVVPDLTAWSERSMAYDDTAADLATEYVTALGRRATSAYDTLDADLVNLLMVGFYDGYDLLKLQFYLRLWDILAQIKGGGVHVAVELKGQ